jgi:hypothetical protein
MVADCFSLMRRGVTKEAPAEGCGVGGGRLFHDRAARINRAEN